jgi:hypothetical protein
MNEHERIEDFKRTRAYVKAKKGDLFPSYASFEWFTRKHRSRLIKSGQFIIRHGSAGNLVGPRFDDVVLEILREEGLREIAMEAAA